MPRNRSGCTNPFPHVTISHSTYDSNIIQLLLSTMEIFSVQTFWPRWGEHFTHCRIHIYIHIYIYIYICIYIYIYKYICIYPNRDILHEYILFFIVPTYSCTCINRHVHIHIHLYIYIYIYIYIYQNDVLNNILIREVRVIGFNSHRHYFRLLRMSW